MDLDRHRLQREIHALYNKEHAALGQTGTETLLKQGQELSQEHQLATTLTDGGVLVFPHAGVQDCGHQIAACVEACLDSGADKVLVISVLHAFTDEMEQARRRVAAGADPKVEKHWGIQGPGLAAGEEWRGDHALISWRYFWQAALAQRGLSPEQAPAVVERYPYLAGGKPEALPYFTEVQAQAENAVIVSTADAFHHGIGYGDAPEDSFPPDTEGLAQAKTVLEEGMALLEKADYWAYNQHCVRAKSDARDAAQVFYALRGPLKGHILDLTYSDASTLYQQPAPTWVAAALFGWQPA